MVPAKSETHPEGTRLLHSGFTLRVNPFNRRFENEHLPMNTSTPGPHNRNSSTWLEPQDFEHVIRFTPLVSIDIIVRSKDGRVLLGRRKNEPALNSFFVPGGRITKNETLAMAFKRITVAELGVEMELSQARFIGVYEHIYKQNFFEKEGFGTHYVVLAYELVLSERPASLPTQQHEDYVWKMEQEILVSPDVHEYTKAYFGGGDRAARANGART